MPTIETQGPDVESILRRDAQLVYDFLRVSQPLQPAEVGIIFGGNSIGPIIMAGALHQRGFIDSIAFMSGGGTSGLHLQQAAEIAQHTGHEIEIAADMTEVEAFRLILEMIGTPPTAIITPNKDQMTWNTKEEAHALPQFLIERIGHTPSATVLTRGWHTRRVNATLDVQARPYLNGAEWNMFPVREPIDTQNLALLKNIAGEVPRLMKYAQSGDISEQNIPDSILQANGRLETALK